MGLFEEIDQNQNKFINISTAVELLALHEGSVYKAVMVLLHYKIDENICCYRQSEYLDFIDIDNDKKEIYSTYEILKDIKSESDLNGGITSQEKSLSHQLKEKIKNYYWELSAINNLGFWGVVTKKTSIKPIEKVGIPTIQQTEPNIESLNAEIARLRNLLADQTTEIQDLKSKIQELETHPTIQDDNPDILALILDETQTDRYAPDLVYSIKLWLDVYVNNPKADSHNNKANTWIKNNTPYNGEQDDTPTRRIREIATPFRDLHQSRKRLLENK